MRILREINKLRSLGEEKIGLLPRHSTTLQLARLVGRANRNSDNRRLTGAVFMDVAKAFDSVGQRLPVQADRPQLPAYC
jgi:hypothetical protein